MARAVAISSILFLAAVLFIIGYGYAVEEERPPIILDDGSGPIDQNGNGERPMTAVETTISVHFPGADILRLNNTEAEFVYENIVYRAAFDETGVMLALWQKGEAPPLDNRTSPGSGPAPRPSAPAARSTGAPPPPSQILTASVVARHKTPSDCWVIISGRVYEMSRYLFDHPGGAETITPYCGKDGTEGYRTKDVNPSRPHSSAAGDLLHDYLIGTIGQKLADGAPVSQQAPSPRPSAVPPLRGRSAPVPAAPSSLEIMVQGVPQSSALIPSETALDVPLFRLGSLIRASETVRVRSSPAGEIVGLQVGGARGFVLVGPRFENQYLWWQVDFDSGSDGWIAQDYFVELSHPTPTPPPSILPSPLPVFVAPPGSALDTVPPVLSIIYPLHGARVSGSFTARADATDTAGVKSVTFDIDGTILGVDTSAPFSISINSMFLVNGIRALRASARDTGENVSMRTISIVVDNIVAQQPPPSPPAKLPGISSATVAFHASPGDCWMVVSDKVYDVTSYLVLHPGGAAVMTPYCGADATTAYNTKDATPPRPHTSAGAIDLAKYFVGDLTADGLPLPQTPPPAPVTQPPPPTAIPLPAPPSTPVPQNMPPVLSSFSATSTNGTSAVEVSFTITALDPDGDALSCLIDFGTGGGFESVRCGDVAYTYSTVGSYTANLRVFDEVNLVVGAPIQITVSATPQAQYTLVQVAAHTSVVDCWLVVQQKVYDVTPYIASNSHPGDNPIIVKYCGTDATIPFTTKDKASPADHTNSAYSILDTYLVGDLIPTPPATPPPTPAIVGTSPVIQSFTASPQLGSVPLSVTFSLTVVDADNDLLTCEIMYGDGGQYETIPCGGSASHTYTSAGQFLAVVRAADATYTALSAAIPITVTGNAGGVFCTMDENIKSRYPMGLQILRVRIHEAEEYNAQIVISGIEHEITLKLSGAIESDKLKSSLAVSTAKQQRSFCDIENIIRSTYPAAIVNEIRLKNEGLVWEVRIVKATDGRLYRIKLDAFGTIIEEMRL